MGWKAVGVKVESAGAVTKMILGVGEGRIDAVLFGVITHPQRRKIIPTNVG
jgi:hypothetical protein